MAKVNKAVRSLIQANADPTKLVKALAEQESKYSQLERRYSQLQREYQKLKTLSKSQRQQIRSLKGQVVAGKEKISEIKIQFKKEQARSRKLEIARQEAERARKQAEKDLEEARKKAEKEAEQARKEAEKALEEAGKRTREQWLEENKINFVNQFIDRVERHYEIGWKSEWSIKLKMAMYNMSQKTLYLQLKELGRITTSTMYESDAVYTDHIDVSTAEQYYEALCKTIGIEDEKNVQKTN